MTTVERLKNLSASWKLDSYDAAMVFSDYLIEMKEIEGANIVRWAAYAMYKDEYYCKNWGKNLYHHSMNKLINEIFGYESVPEEWPNIFIRWKDNYVRKQSCLEEIPCFPKNERV